MLAEKEKFLKYFERGAKVKPENINEITKNVQKSLESK